MPVNFIPSAEQVETRQKNTARKRLRNQNSEIDELAALLPIKQPSTLGNGAVARGRNQSIDKISVLRLTSAYLKFQKYMEKDQQKGRGVSEKAKATPTTDLLSEALDGFLLVLDSEGTILYASDSITNIVGLTQHDVVGQNLADITDEDDLPTITKNLQSSTTPPSTHLDGRTELQHKQFFVRIKSSLTPGRMQLSRFKSHIMIQVSGNLKVHIPFQSHIEPKQKGAGSEPQVLGFVGECRPIESTSSILEVSVPQSHFTSTINLEMKIISVEASVKEVVGYDPADFVGTDMCDYFHPGDYKHMIPCEKTLMHLHHAVSPVFRFMSSSGEWVWMQMEGVLRYKIDGAEPQFWEVKAKLVSQEDGHMKYVEYREMYAKSSDPNQDILRPHKDPAVMACLMDTENRCRKKEGAEPIIDSLKDAQVSSSLIDPVLHGREVGLSALPGQLKRVLTENDADDYVIWRNKELGWPIPDVLQQRARELEQKLPSPQNGSQDQAIYVNPLYTSALIEGYPGNTSTALASDTTLQQNGYLDQGPVQADVLSSSDVRDSLSPVGSGLDGYSLSNLHTTSPSHLHTLTPSHSLDTPPDSVASTDHYSSNPSLIGTNNRNTPSTNEFSQILVPPLIDQSHALTQVDSGGFDFTPFAQNVSSDVNFSPQTVSSDIVFSTSQTIVDPSLQVSTPSQPSHAHHTLNTPPQNSPHSYTPSQNGFHGTTLPTHPLNKTTSLSSLASSIASPQNFSDCSSPQSLQGTPLTPSQGTTLTPSQGTPLTPNHLSDTECLDHILSGGDHAPISPEQVFLTTENDSLEQILSDMISLNQGGVGVGSGRISVECEVVADGGVGDYQNGGFPNNDADDVIQQFLS